jgi:hypothetical protein
MRACLRRTLPALTVLFIVTSESAAGASARPPTSLTCERVKGVAFPTGDQPEEAETKALQGCSSEGLLYGIAQAVDPAKARTCAYLERSAGDERVFGGSAILMTIYANGLGVRRNLDLALHLACGLDAAPAEMESRIAHLERMRSQAAGQALFSLCDDVTSGFMGGHCAAHELRIKQAKRTQRHDRALTGWTAAQRAAFKKLRATANAFFQARTANEIDLSGTARSALEAEEEDNLEAAFDKISEALEHRSVPPASPANLAEVDRRLNALYGRIMNAKGNDWGTVTRDGIRATERQWVKYRDGWTAFAGVAYPNADASALKGWLTQQRMEMLTAFAPTLP